MMLTIMMMMVMMVLSAVNDMDGIKIYIWILMMVMMMMIRDWRNSSEGDLYIYCYW